MKAVARFKNEILCMDVPYADKLAKDNNGVKYLVVRQDLFDRTEEAKGKKTNDSKEKDLTNQNLLKRLSAYTLS